jgi:hypothetical protein
VWKNGHSILFGKMRILSFGNEEDVMLSLTTQFEDCSDADMDIKRTS